MRVESVGSRVMVWRSTGCSAGIFSLGFQDAATLATAACAFAKGAGFRVQGAGCRVQGSGFRVQGSEFRVQGSGFISLGFQDAATLATAACACERERE